MFLECRILFVIDLFMDTFVCGRTTKETWTIIPKELFDKQYVLRVEVDARQEKLIRDLFADLCPVLPTVWN